MTSAFDETYPPYEFAPLVTLAAALAGWVRTRIESGKARTGAPDGAAGQAA